MSKLVRLPNSRQIREQAAAWIVCLDEGISDAQMSELKAWLAADPAHRTALIRMAEQWDAFDALSELAEILPLRQESSRFNRLSLTATALGIFAAAAVAAGLYFTVFNERAAPMAAVHVAEGEPRTSHANQAAPGSFKRSLRTAVGQQLTSEMPDGSVVSLNTNTVLTVQYSGEERLMILEKGEASFNVARDTSRPFRVRAGERTVQAVGTVFNVRREAGSSVQVAVAEGIVKITDRPDPTQQELLVSAGQLAEISETTTKIQRVEPSRMEAIQAWQRGLLIYQGETLQDVIADVSRYTSVRFVIEDEAIRERRVGGVFRAGDVDGLLLALRESFGIEPHRQGDVVILNARN